MARGFSGGERMQFQGYRNTCPLRLPDSQPNKRRSSFSLGNSLKKALLNPRIRKMTLSKGWINRQITRVERDVKDWPDWMRREAALRTEEQKAPTTSSKTVKE